MKVWITLAWAGMATWASMVAATAAPIDTARSRLSVSFRQMNVPVEATFTRFGGDVSLDPSRPMQARAKLEIDPASFHMGVGAEDYAAEVRRKDWFDTARFPRASFVLIRVQALGSDRHEAVGTLEVNGLSPLHISEPTRLRRNSYHVFCLKKKNIRIIHVTTTTSPNTNLYF